MMMPNLIFRDPKVPVETTMAVMQMQGVLDRLFVRSNRKAIQLVFDLTPGGEVRLQFCDEASIVFSF